MASDFVFSPSVQPNLSTNDFFGEPRVGFFVLCVEMSGVRDAGVWDGTGRFVERKSLASRLVVDTAFYGPNTPTPDDTFDPTGILDGYVSYLVYVNMTNPTDVISSVFSDTSVLPQGGALGINAECECWNPIAESMVLDGTNSSFFWTIEPLLQYDTFWTIGKLSSDMPGDDPSWLSNPNVFGDAICGTEVNGRIGLRSRCSCKCCCRR